MAVSATVLGGCSDPPSIVVQRGDTAPAVSGDAPRDGRRGEDPTMWSGPGPLEPNAVIDHVVDGDTVAVRLRADGSGAEETVRLIGIDTPETKRPATPVQCFGPEASAATAAVLPKREPVHLVLDVEERDRYGRLLAYVYRGRDGLFVNMALAREGFALVLTYPPNVAHTDEFVDAVGDARANGLGLWSACGDPAAPAR
jgi:micrococcal nuclease